MSTRTAAFVLLLVGAGGCAIGPTELMLVLAIVVVLFGGSKLPALGKALGESVKNFREGTQAGLKGEAEDPQARRDEPPPTDKPRLTNTDREA